MTRPHDGLYAALTGRGLSRRAFLRFTTAITGVLALPVAYAPRITAAVERAPRLPVIWLRGQSCGGNTEAFLAATRPTTTELLLELLRVEYCEGLMAPAGVAAVAARTSALERYPDGYLAVVEGSIPTEDGGTASMVGGRPLRDVVRETCDGALATIAVGSCAFDGGAPAAIGGTTGAVGVGEIAGTERLVNLPGCPLNVENLAATIVHYLTFGQLPETDWRRRPYFAYGGLLHNQCERRAHFEFGEFATAWGDEASQKGWCLYKLGCKGPEVFANCPTALYAGKTSWAIKAGHGCIGCTMPDFWDAMGPAYSRLPATIPFLPNLTADGIGLGLVGAVAGATALHAVATNAREIRGRLRARTALPAPEPAPTAVPAPAAELVAESAPAPEPDEQGGQP